MILDEMLSADGVLFESPVYVNTITSIMKNFIERVGYISHRPIFHDKFAMLMAVCGGFGADEANRYMDDIFSSFGFNIVSSVELRIGTKSEREKTYNRGLTTATFDTLISRIEKGERNSPSLRQLIMFEIFKLLAEKFPDTYQADYEYYKDKPEFPYDGKISFFKKVMAKRIAKSSVKEMMENR
jgi:multimeric flavodoxin WrbA